MERHENMVSHNQRRNNRKEANVIKEINKMLKNDEQVTIGKLVKITGMSRAYFYNNQVVHAEVLRAQKEQEGKTFVREQEVIFDKAMIKEIEVLKRNLAEKEMIISELKAENAKLQKKADCKISELLGKL